MQPIIVPQMASFLKVAANEEPIDQPLYHIQSYAAAGTTLSYTFFNTAVGGATNGFSDTNMDSASVLSAGKRFAIFGISVAFLPGANPSVTQGTTANIIPASAMNDAKLVLEGIANLQLTILDKPYYQIAPLAYLPAGFGAFVSSASISNNQQTAANASFIAGYANNGVPMVGASRRLRVPIPIPQQVRFSVTVTLAATIAVSTASRIGVFLDGVLIRAMQ
jgi:hypothetical protein